jgi:hypothetical protein
MKNKKNVTTSMILILMNHAREQAKHFNVDVLETESSEKLEKMIESEGFTQEQALDILQEAFGNNSDKIVD